MLLRAVKFNDWIFSAWNPRIEFSIHDCGACIVSIILATKVVRIDTAIRNIRLLRCLNTSHCGNWIAYYLECTLDHLQSSNTHGHQIQTKVWHERKMFFSVHSFLLLICPKNFTGKKCIGTPIYISVYHCKDLDEKNVWGSRLGR